MSCVKSVKSKISKEGLQMLTLWSVRLNKVRQGTGGCIYRDIASHSPPTPAGKVFLMNSSYVISR